MKWFKRIVMVFLLLLSLTSCNQKKNPMLIGISYTSVDNVSLNSVYEDNINCDFLLNHMPVNLLYEFIDKNSESLNSNKKLIKQMKKSSSIIINVGLDDLYSVIKIKNKEISYNQKYLDEQLEFFEYYLNLSMEEIYLNIKKPKLFFVSLFNPYILEGDNKEKVINIIEKYNNVMKTLTNQFQMTYIDVTLLEDYLVLDGRLSSEGIYYLQNRINEAVYE